MATLQENTIATDVNSQIEETDETNNELLAQFIPATATSQHARLPQSRKRSRYRHNPFSMGTLPKCGVWISRRMVACWPQAR